MWATKYWALCPRIVILLGNAEGEGRLPSGSFSLGKPDLIANILLAKSTFIFRISFIYILLENI